MSLKTITVDRVTSSFPAVLPSPAAAPSMAVTHKVADELGMPYAVGITVEAYAKRLGGAPARMMSVKLERMLDGLIAFKWASDPAVLQEQSIDEALESDEFQELLESIEQLPKYLITFSQASGVTWYHPLIADFLLRWWMPAAGFLSSTLYAEQLISVSNRIELARGITDMHALRSLRLPASVLEKSGNPQAQQLAREMHERAEATKSSTRWASAMKRLTPMELFMLPHASIHQRIAAAQ